MLGKLLKYEYKATARIFLPIYLVIIFLAFINRVTMPIDKLAGINAVTIFIMTLLIMISGVLILIISIERFYKNLLSTEGYLMFTLPVKPWELVMSKLLVSFTWLVLAGIVALIALFIMLFNIQDVSLIINTLGSAIKEAAQNFDMGMVANIVSQVIIIGVLSYISIVLNMYAALCMGQISKFNRHRILVAFISFIILNWIINIARVGLIWLAGNIFGIDNPIILINTMTISTILISVILFFLTTYLLKNHLNLE